MIRMDFDLVDISLFGNPEIQGGNVMRNDNAGVVRGNIRFVSDLSAVINGFEWTGLKPHCKKNDDDAKDACYYRFSFHDSLQGSPALCASGL